MSAAFQRLAGFVLARDAGAAAPARLQTRAIASILFVACISGIVTDVRQQQVFAQLFNVTITSVTAVAAVSLFFRNRIGYAIVYLNALFIGIGASSAALWVPMLVLTAADTQAGSPVDTLIIYYVWSLVWVALIVAAFWRLLALYGWLRKVADGWAAPALGLVIAGGALFIASSIVGFVDPTMVQGWLTTTTIDPWLRLAVFAIVLIPIFAYAMWSYATLRSRAVRDDFGLP